MKIAILTIFPDMLKPLISESIIGRGVKNGILEFDIINIRDFSASKHKNTDDYPYGGGSGMLMTAQPIGYAFKHVKTLNYTGKRIFMGPRGRKLDQKLAEELSVEKDLTILCGHYEGVDERVLEENIDMEISIGDYILTGGELAAMVLTDSIVRLIPGVLGSESSIEEESFTSGLLEYPQYSRPRIYNGMEVPDVLLSGNHAEINKWRREQSLLVTYKNRPDLLNNVELSKEDIAFLKKLESKGGLDG